MVTRSKMLFNRDSIKPKPKKSQDAKARELKLSQADNLKHVRKLVKK